MQPLRAQLIAHRAWFAVLVACTLAVRLLVPTGFMPALDGGHVTLQLCSGVMPAQAMTAMPGMHHGQADHDKGGKSDTAEMPCAFAGFGIATLDAVPPALLIAALAYAFQLVIRKPVRAPPQEPAHVRPGSRAPPVPA